MGVLMYDDKNYTYGQINLPIASSNDLGGIKVGDNLSIDSSGKLKSVRIQSNWNQTDINADDYIKGKPNLATVATSGSYNDLSNKPNLATVAISGSYSDLTGKPSLATVATSGSYNDLSNKPYIPSDYNLPTASSSTKGGIKIDGNCFGVSNEKLYINAGEGLITDSNGLLNLKHFAYTSYTYHYNEPIDIIRNSWHGGHIVINSEALTEVFFRGGHITGIEARNQNTSTTWTPYPTCIEDYYIIYHTKEVHIKYYAINMDIVDNFITDVIIHYAYLSDFIN